MRKISGIIPSSPRVTTVDLANSGASRPGMPTFGRVQGTSSLAKANNAYLTSFSKDISMDPKLGRRRPMDPQMRHEQIVADVANGFFLKKAAEHQSPTVEVGLQKSPNSLETQRASQPQFDFLSGEVELPSRIELSGDPRLQESLDETGSSTDQDMDTAVVGHNIDITI
ncbi:MAG: hypothetical protein KDD61_18115 [Bdellovibrionales bacterium]|nr:hypothetical protein [Bdellovibrionales bacterium]